MSAYNRVCQPRQQESSTSNINSSNSQAITSTLSANNSTAAAGLYQPISNAGVKKMSHEVAKVQEKSHELSLIEQVVMQGDLSKLTPEQRVVYYNKVCESCGLNPFTSPFAYINLNGKLTLYAKKDCTEQLRHIRGISIVSLESQLMDDLYIVKAYAETKDGRKDASTGAVTLGNLKGDSKANAIMKAETKAKRRVTLSISGMGWVDESEIDSIPNAKCVDIDIRTGEINGETIQITQKNSAKITAEQANELKMIIDECDPKYKAWFYERLKQSFNSENISDFPVELYEKMKSAAVKNMHQQHAKQMAEYEANTPEVLQVEAQ